VGERYAVLQANPNLRVHTAEITALVDSLEEAGICVVEVPIAPALGDRTGRLGVGHPVAFDPCPDPLVLADLVGGAEAVIGYSLHLSIVALTQGVPVIRPADAPGSKWAELDRYENVRTLGEGTARLAVEELGRRAVEPAVADETEGVARHWDDVAALVGAPRRPRSARVARLLTELTTVLEQHGSTLSRADAPPVRRSRPRLSSRLFSAALMRLHSQ
jgi:lipopolysaccharide transport system ATP-binding protein